MLQQLIYVIIVSLTCITWGLPVYIYFQRKGNEKYWLSNGFSSLIFLFFAGLLSISLFSSWLAFIAPLKFKYLFISTIIILLAVLIFSRSKTLTTIQQLKTGIKLSLPALYFLIACTLLFITLGTLKPVNIDTQLYHLQIIRWNNEYGTVPGLANLYPRLGLSSNWFNLVSFFYIPAFDHQNFTYLNTTVTIWFLCWLIFKWHQFHVDIQNQYCRPLAFFYFLLIIYFLFDWQLFRDTANSTAYDLIITALTIIVLTYFVEDILIEKKTKFSPLLILAALLIIPFKLSGVFILVPVLFYLLKFKKADIWFKTILAGCLILFPLLLRNYIISGYPLYPSTFSVGHPDWQLPFSMTEKFNEYVLYVNKFYNHNLGFIFNYEKTSLNWIPFWFNGILFQHKILLVLVGLSFLMFFYKSESPNSQLKFRLFILSLWLMTAGWFFTAPDPRFAYGFLLFLAFLPLSLFAGKYITYKVIYNVAFLILIPALLIYGYSKANIIIKYPTHLLYVIENDSPAFSENVINESIYNKTERINYNWNNRCFFTHLPCLCEENPYLIRRGGSLKDGFRMNPITDSNFIQQYNY